MKDRKAKVYWFQDEKKLIFDPGYVGGDIHIYNHDQSMSATHLEEKLKLFGHYMDWDIRRPGDPVTKKELEQALRDVQNSLWEFRKIFERAIE